MASETIRLGGMVTVRRAWVYTVTRRIGGVDREVTTFGIRWDEDDRLVRPLLMRSISVVWGDRDSERRFVFAVTDGMGVSMQGAGSDEEMAARMVGAAFPLARLDRHLWRPRAVTPDWDGPLRPERAWELACALGRVLTEMSEELARGTAEVPG